MNINHLAIFHAVAQEGGIGRGAERLHISQPAVSKQLQELERSLGTPLFDRLPRGVRLTGAGVILADYARRLFALEAEAEEALADLRGLERGTLAVGASMTIGSYLLPEVLARFHRRYPGVALSLEIANTEDIQQRLLDGALDLGLTEGFAEEADLEAAVFAQDAMVVIAPPNHPIRAEGPVLAERLCREPFVVREEGSGTRAVIARAFAERGLTIRPAMSLGNIEAIKRAVAAGVGLAVVSSLTIALELETHRVAVVPVSDFAFTRPLHLLTRRGRHQSRAAKALVAELST
ncbi:MAG: LysR family transcriptional regulator [Capsulimonas sp.]|uniref:LysR family transcriptional regulator n=1 Tax=Capsulimonas sp. TaxID=2494211 RepID=UPI00326500B5